MATRRGGAATVRRKRIWARETTSATVVADSSTSVDLLGDFTTAYGANAILGATIARIRGTLSWYSTGTLDASVTLAAGILVQDASGAADPVGSPHADWMWYSRQGSRVTYLATGNGVVTSQVIPVDWNIDCKAMRKCEELGEAPYLVLNNSLGNPGTYFIDTSTLVLLP